MLSRLLFLCCPYISTCSDAKMDSKKDSMQPENLSVAFRLRITDSKSTACIVA